MDIENVKARIKELLCENLGIDEDVLEYDTELFGELIDLDSIDSMTIIAVIDDEYGVSMTGVDREHFQTVETLAAYVVSHMENE
mgnify:CR=1 FL=1